MSPNLFDFATSELSQDAVLCWLLAWASPENKQHRPCLHQIGNDLLNFIFSHYSDSTPPEYRKVEVKRQVGRIDILCMINNEIVILIEDKRGSMEHSNQLARYKEHVSSQLGFPAKNIIPVYLQTGDQSNYLEAKKHGYIVLDRLSLLQIFESSNGTVACNDSDTLRDFWAHLRALEDDIQSFHHLPLNEWSWNSWKGFYIEIQRALGDGNWNYVSNPSGGFLGFYWHFTKQDGCVVYLQLEQEKFCFKISVEDKERQADLRNYWKERILRMSSERSLKVNKPNRLGRGKCMTVAVLEQDFRVLDCDGRLAMERTILVLRSAQKILDECTPLFSP
jgi:hypothetical protein